MFRSALRQKRAFLFSIENEPVAQLVEQLTFNQ